MLFVCWSPYLIIKKIAGVVKISIAFVVSLLLAGIFLHVSYAQEQTTQPTVVESEIATETIPEVQTADAIDIAGTPQEDDTTAGDAALTTEQGENQAGEADIAIEVDQTIQSEGDEDNADSAVVEESESISDAEVQQTVEADTPSEVDIPSDGVQCLATEPSGDENSTDAATSDCAVDDEVADTPAAESQGEQPVVDESESAQPESAEPAPVESDPIFEITIPDPYFYISGVKYSYLPTGGDCTDKTNCLVSATPIQDALNYAKTQILDDDTIYLEAGALYGESFSISDWTNPLTLRPDDDGATSLGGAITISSNSAPIVIRDFWFAPSATINLSDSPNVTLAGSDKYDDTFDISLSGSGEVNLNVQAGEPDFSENTERVLVDHLPFDDSDSLLVHGTSGNDIIKFDASFTRNGNQRVTYDVVESIGLDGGGGTDTLIGPDAATTFDITGANSGILTTSDSTLPFVSFENLSGATKVDTFILQDAGSLSGNLQGDSLSDILDYSYRTSAVTVNLTTGSAPGIAGLVSTVEEVIGTSLADTLTGDANDNKLTGNGGADVLIGNDGNDTLAATLSGVSALTITVDGGNGDDALTVFGTSAVDSFVVDIANRQVTRSGNQVVTYSGFADAGDSIKVDGSGGNDTLAASTTSTYFRITDDNGGQVIYEVPLVGSFDISTAIDADANTINLSAAHGLALGDKVFYHASAGSTQDVGLLHESFYYIVPTVDPNVIQLADSAENAKLGTGIVSLSLGMASEAHWLTQWERLEFTKIENLTGGTGDDTFWFANDGKLDGAINGGFGNDTIRGANDATDFIISGANAGLIETTVFTSIENIIGGEADDTFTVGTAGSLSGILRAGGGDDTLNGPDLVLTWNLTDAGKGSTTGLIFSQVENLVAGDLNDIFNFIKSSISITHPPLPDGDGETETFFYFGSMPGILDGAGGTDSLYGPDWKYDWEIDALNGGTLHDTTPFANIENLYGGTEEDNFIFKPGGSISGLIDGGLTGDNALDFEDQTGDVTVNLTTNVAILTGGASFVGSFANFVHAFGGGGNDSLTGDANNNTLIGNLGHDHIYGLAGNDNLVGGPGDDILEGGADNDTYDFTLDEDDTYPWGSDTIIDTGGSADKIDFRTSVLGVTFNLGLLTAQVVASYNAVTMLTLTLTTVSIENMIGGYGDDTLTGSSADNIIEGYRGNDTLDGGGGVNTLSFEHNTYKGITVDLGSGSMVNDEITDHDSVLNVGFDTFTNFQNIRGTFTDDTLIGDANNNILYGDDGNDSLEGKGGNDTLYGGAGDDTYVFDLDNLLGTDTINDTSGSDWLDFSSSTIEVDMNLGTTFPQWVDAATMTNLRLSVTGVENIKGGSGNDVLTGDANDNIFIGNGGNDSIGGGGGSDTVDYNATTAGITLTRNSTTFQMTGSEVDTDTLSGIFTIIGGSGNDAFAIDADSLTSESYDIQGGSGSDLINFALTASALAVNLSILAAQSVVTGKLTLTLSGIENVTGGSTNNTLTGDDNANILTGGAGIDVINAGLGNDTLYGGLGANNLNGGEGSDWVNYNASSSDVTVSLAITTAQTTWSTASDTLSNIENIIGSAFADTLTGDANDNILRGGLGGDILTGGGSGDNDTVDYSDASVAVTVNLATSTMSGADAVDVISNFESVIGSAYNDTLTGDANANQLTGGSGNDTLVGGASDDTYFFGSNWGVDTISDTAGDNDEVNFNPAVADVSVLIDSTTVVLTDDANPTSNKVTYGTLEIESFVGSQGISAVSYASGATILTNGQNHSLTATTINIPDNVTISTRMIGAGTDHLNSPSVGNSGDIIFNAKSISAWDIYDDKTITIGNNVKLLAHVNTIVNPGSPPSDWTGGPYTVESTASSGSGFGMTATIAVAAGIPTVQVLSWGANYANGDTITFHAPAGTGTDIVVTATVPAFTAGAITMEALDVAEFSGLLVLTIRNVTTEINIGNNVIMRGGTILIHANADARKNLQESSPIGETIIESLESLSLFAGVSISESTSKIKVGTGTVINGNTVKIHAESRSDAHSQVFSTLFGIVVVKSKTTATIEIGADGAGAGTYIAADNNLDILTHARGNISGSVSVFYFGKGPGKLFDIAFAYGQLDIVNTIFVLNLPN